MIVGTVFARRVTMDTMIMCMTMQMPVPRPMLKPRQGIGTVMMAVATVQSPR